MATTKKTTTKKVVKASSTSSNKKTSITDLVSNCKNLLGSWSLIEDGKELLEKATNLCKKWKTAIEKLKSKDKSKNKADLLKDWKEMLEDGKVVYTKWKKIVETVKSMKKKK